jgi:hypothetical protein
MLGINVGCELCVLGWNSGVFWCLERGNLQRCLVFAREGGDGGGGVMGYEEDGERSLRIVGREWVVGKSEVRKIYGHGLAGDVYGS